MGDRKLLFAVTKDDFRIDTFRAGGKGGQNQNKTDSGVRFTHIESGAVGEARDERSQLQNKKAAFERCVNSPKFKAWHKRKVSIMLTGEDPEQHVVDRRVDFQMQDRFLKIETGSEVSI